MPETIDTVLRDLHSLSQSTKSRGELVDVLKRLGRLLSNDVEAQVRMRREFEQCTNSLQRALLLIALGSGLPDTRDWIRSRTSEQDPIIAVFAELALLHQHSDIRVVGYPAPVAWIDALLLVGFTRVTADGVRGYAHFCDGSCLGPMGDDPDAWTSSTPRPFVQTVFLYQGFAADLSPEDWDTICDVVERGQDISARKLGVKLLDASQVDASHDADRFIARFLRMLLSSRLEDRTLGVEGLGACRSEAGARALLEVASQGTQDADVRDDALLSVMNSPYDRVAGAGGQLRALLKDPDESIRWHAVVLLPAIHDRESTAALANTLLSDESPQVRGQALREMEEWPGLEDPSVVEALSQLFRQDPDSSIAAEASEDLAELKRAESLPRPESSNPAGAGGRPGGR